MPLFGRTAAHESTRRWWHVPLLAVGVLLPAVWIIWIRVLVISDGTHVLPTPGRSAVVIETVYSDDSNLSQRDIVLAVDGIPMDTWIAGQGPEVERVDGDQVVYTVERDGVVLDRDVRLGAYPFWGAVRATGFMLVLVVLTYLVVAAVFLARPFDLAARTMLIVGLALPWLITEFPLGIQVIDLVGGAGVLGYVVGDLAACVVWGGMLHLVLVFPEPASVLRRRPWLAVGCYLLPVLLYALPLTWTLPANTAAIDRFFDLVTVSATAAIVVPLLITIRVVLVYRLTSDPDGRRRIRWIIGSFVVAMVCYFGLGQLAATLIGHPLVGYQWLTLPFLLMPLAVGAAILRYRLFDVEVILSRSLLVGGLTLAVAAVYVGIVLAVLNIRFLSPPSTLTALLIGGAVTAAAFTLRKRLARRVTSLVYGQRDDPHAVVERLSEVDTATAADRVLKDVVRTLALALRLPYARLELRGPDGVLEVEAQYGDSTGQPTVLPIGSDSEVLGQLELEVGPGREPFGPADRRLLDDISRHVAEACRTVLLARALQRSRERLILAREEERRRLRRDLHDGVGPTLAALSMQLEVASGMIGRDPGAASLMLDKLGSATRALLGDVRHIVDDLRPAALDELGLLGAISEHSQAFDAGLARQSGFSVDVTADGDLGDLPAAVEVAAFRIVIEAVTNAARHSGGRHCTVVLHRDSGLSIDVSDDGCGLPSMLSRKGVGLGSMRERAAELGGECTISSRTDGPGTAVRVHLPLHGSGRLT